MDLGIRDRVAVVTGGDSGMGLKSAEYLLREGVRVVLTDKEKGPLDEAIKSLSGLGEVVAVAADLTRPRDVDRLAKEAEAAFGKAHILVHAAGITGPTGDFLDLTEADWQTAIDADFLAATRVLRAFLPGMKALGWGRVVLFSSEDAQQPYADELPYCACKAAINNLAKGLSKAYARDGILVNVVSPAFIATPMTDAMMEKRAAERGTSVDEAIRSFLKEERPTLELRRRGEAEEVAAAVAFLCSAQASFITGANLRIDGGSVASV